MPSSSWLAALVVAAASAAAATTAAAASYCYKIVSKDFLASSTGFLSWLTVGAGSSDDVVEDDPGSSSLATNT